MYRNLCLMFPEAHECIEEWLYKLERLDIIKIRMDIEENPDELTRELDILINDLESFIGFLD